MATILMTGGTGMIGQSLCRLLKENGHSVILLTRHIDVQSPYQQACWDPDANTVDQEAVWSANVIIHLAGENIGNKRWTTEQKKRIRDSRINTCNLLFETVKEKPDNLETFISASAIGYYGINNRPGAGIESAPPGNDFLAETCRLWENAAFNFNQLPCRTVVLRTALVLDAFVGLLPQLRKVTKLGLLTPFGKGDQAFSWIHLDDLCRVYLWAVENKSMKGAYNAVAPEPITNRSMTAAMNAFSPHHFKLPPVPAWILRLGLGERAQLVLSGNPVSADKLLQTGVQLTYTKFQQVLMTFYRENQ